MFLSLRRPTFWLGILSLVLVAGALGHVIRQGRPPAPPRGVAPPDPSEEVVEQALDQIPTDSTALKSRWVDEVVGVDLTGLRGGQRELLVRFANARRCTCGCGYTLAACRIYDPTCPVSLPILAALRDSVIAGRIRSAEGIRARPRG